MRPALSLCLRAGRLIRITMTLCQCARVQVTRGGGLDGARLDALTGRSRVLSVRHSGEQAAHRIVRRWTTLEAGDEAFVVGPHEELLSLLRQDALPSNAERSGTPPGS